MDRRQVAKRLKCNVQHITTLMKRDPTFPVPVRRGKGDFWNPVDIDAWERAHMFSVHEQNQRRLALLTAPKKAKR